MKKYWDLILGGIIFIYSMFLVITWGNISFTYPLLGLSIVLIGHYFVKEKIKGYKIYKFSRVLFFVGITFFIIIESVIIFYPKSNTEKSEYILVLGAGVNGTTPSLTLKGRLDKTIEYVNKYDKNVKVVVSGGQGPGEDITEALCMKDYLMANGLKEENIIMEDKSTSTGENFKFSKKVIENHAGKAVDELKIKVITNDFHTFRSNMLGERQGYEDLTFYSSSTYTPLIPVYYIRESVAFVKSYLFD